MAKKGKKEKVGRKPPSALSRNKPAIPPCTTEDFELQANDLESTIASLQQKCDLLSVELKDLQHSYSWKLQEREDVESYLMRLLSGKETELQDLRNRYQELVDLGATVQNEHGARLSCLQGLEQSNNEQVENDSLVLKSRLQQMTEVFDAREKLTKRFRTLRAEIREQDDTNWASIAEFEKQVILAQDSKKRQVFEYLIRLAYEFRRASRQAQAIHSREMLRQNVTLSTDLHIMSDETMVVARNNQKIEERNRQTSMQLDIYGEDLQLWQKRVAKIEKTLQLEAERAEQLQASIAGESDDYFCYVDGVEEKLRASELQLAQYRKHIAHTREKLHARQQSVGRLEADIKNNKHARRKCHRLLAEVCLSINYAVIAATQQSAFDSSLTPNIVDRAELKRGAIEAPPAPLRALDETTMAVLAMREESTNLNTAVISIDRALLNLLNHAVLLRRHHKQALPPGTPLYKNGDFGLVPGKTPSSFRVTKYTLAGVHNI